MFSPTHPHAQQVGALDFHEIESEFLDELEFAFVEEASQAVLHHTAILRREVTARLGQVTFPGAEFNWRRALAFHSDAMSAGEPLTHWCCVRRSPLLSNGPPCLYKLQNVYSCLKYALSSSYVIFSSNN